MNNVVAFPRDKKPPADLSAPAEYELHWARRNRPHMITSRDPDRMIRQMESLRDRAIPAALYRDGILAGTVGVGADGRYNITLF